MKILFWIIAIIAIYFIYAYFSGYQRQLNYQRAIADLTQELAINPHQFFAPKFNYSNNIFIGRNELNEFIMLKVIELSLERNIRSPINANIIPPDIMTLPNAKQDFEKLCAFAYSVVNDRN